MQNTIAAASFDRLAGFYFMDSHQTIKKKLFHFTFDCRIKVIKVIVVNSQEQQPLWQFKEKNGDMNECNQLEKQDFNAIIAMLQNSCKTTNVGQ